MKIEITEHRKIIQEKIDKARVIKPEGMFDPLEGISGVFLHEIRNWADDDWYRCANWVFWLHFKEEWAKPGSNLANFWKDSEKFIAPYGYRRISKPHDGDIVGYKDSMSFMHWGILLRDRRVRSKFAMQNVYTHELEIIPSVWGDEVVYFRKENLKARWFQGLERRYTKKLSQ